MRESIYFSLIAVLFASSVEASVSVSVDVVEIGDGISLPPPGIIAVDVLVTVSDGDTWTAAGVTGRTLNGATLRYATDPNGNVALTNPGTADRFVTFFSRPRERDATNRYTIGAAAAAGAYSPTGPLAIATPDQINVAYFASPPPTSDSPTVSGAIFRIAINRPAATDFYSPIVYPRDQVPSGGFIWLFESTAVGPAPGTVSASFDNPTPVGSSWVLGLLVPEPASAAGFLLAGLVLLQIRRG